MRNPDVYKASELKNWNNYTESKKGYIPSRPIQFFGLRWFKNLKISYNVLIGKYDALDWEDGDDYKRKFK